MKHSITKKLSLFMFIALALPIQSFGMFKWFMCGCGSKRQSLCYKPLATDEYNIQERSSECRIQPKSVADTVKKILPASFTPEMLELILAYRSLEMKNTYILRDIYSSMKEIPGQKLELQLQSSDEEKQAVELYDIETGKKLKADQKSSVAMQGDAPKVQVRSSNSVGIIALSNSGSADFCADKTIKVFNKDGGQQTLQECHPFKSDIDERRMAPLSDGGFVFAIPLAYNHFKIKQWNVGQPTLKTIDIKQSVYSIAEYHKGFLAVSVSFKEVMLFNLRTGEQVGSLASDPRHETDLLPLSGGRLLTYETHAGYDADARTEFKVWE